MKKTAYWQIAFLTAITLVLFYPLFYTRYFYTDEVVQLWRYRKGSPFHMFIPQGRYLTDQLFVLLFSSIHTIGQIRLLHIFSLLGWIICLPVWYRVFSRVCGREGLNHMLPFFACLYLVTCPPFAVYVSWAACMELFIASTTGLMAGYILYIQMRETDGRVVVPPWAVFLSLVCGIVSLFTYQNGFGCFLLPFLLQVLARKKPSRTVCIGAGIYLLTYLLYYLLFRWQLSAMHTNTITRTDISPSPLSKLGFLFARPLPGAFRLTWILNERSAASLIVFVFMAGAWLSMTLFLLRGQSLFFRLRYLAGILCFMVLVYLPSLAVRENFASNRTLLALDLTVFLLFFTTLPELLRTERARFIIALLAGALFISQAWYNFRYQFLGPVKREYDLVRNYIETNYHPGITGIDFIRPRGDLFQRQYGIQSSWDEFGVPSDFFEWVPEHFVRQVVFEKTGDRPAADNLVIRTWLAPAGAPPGGLPGSPPGVLPGGPGSPGPSPSGNTLIIDTERILQ